MRNASLVRYSILQLAYTIDLYSPYRQIETTIVHIDFNQQSLAVRTVHKRRSTAAAAAQVTSRQVQWL